MKGDKNTDSVDGNRPNELVLSISVSTQMVKQLDLIMAKSVLRMNGPRAEDFGRTRVGQQINYMTGLFLSIGAKNRWNNENGTDLFMPSVEHISGDLLSILNR